MKNTYKKQDAKGNELSEEIGKGINEVHLKLVLQAREVAGDDTHSFRIDSELKKEFKKLTNYNGMLRAFCSEMVKLKK